MAKNRTDILLAEDYDLQVRDGDLVAGPSDEQHIQCILVANPGDFRLAPMVGCGLQRLHHGRISQQFRRNMQIQLKADGYRIEDITLDVNGN